MSFSTIVTVKNTAMKESNKTAETIPNFHLFLSKIASKQTLKFFLFYLPNFMSREP